MRLGRLVAGGLVAGALAGFAAGLLRPRPRGVLPGLAPTPEPSIAGSASPEERAAPDESGTPEPPAQVGAEGAETPQPVGGETGQEAYAGPDPDGDELLVGENGGHLTVSAGRSRPRGDGAG